MAQSKKFLLNTKVNNFNNGKRTRIKPTSHEHKPNNERVRKRERRLNNTPNAERNDVRKKKEEEDKEHRWRKNKKQRWMRKIANTRRAQSFSLEKECEKRFLNRSFFLFSSISHFTYHPYNIKAPRDNRNYQHCFTCFMQANWVIWVSVETLKSHAISFHACVGSWYWHWLSSYFTLTLNLYALRLFCHSFSHLFPQPISKVIQKQELLHIISFIIYTQYSRLCRFLIVVALLFETVYFQRCWLSLTLFPYLIPLVASFQSLCTIYTHLYACMLI